MKPFCHFKRCGLRSLACLFVIKRLYSDSSGLLYTVEVPWGFFVCLFSYNSDLIGCRIFFKEYSMRIKILTNVEQANESWGNRRERGISNSYLNIRNKSTRNSYRFSDICEQYSTRIKTLTYFGQPICSYHFKSAKKKLLKNHSLSWYKFNLEIWI